MTKAKPTSPATDMPKHFDHQIHETAVTARWEAADAFAAVPDDRADRYVIMMPLPNVTGALHMGHAMDNVMQDLLTRWRRMSGANTLWMPGTDHAGIATQAVVEKRLFELEGKTRLDIGRDALIAKIWAWKDEYQQRIIRQQKSMGCSCDWLRQRFTMDAVCARAVREAFFRLFRDGLVFRGDRLVNWDCLLRTAVSDDEIVHETVQGHFWHIRYPVIDPLPGEPAHITVATTRPETMLGDTAVACHPDPASALDEAAASLRARIAVAPKKEKPQLERELEEVEARRTSHLPLLLKLRDMARAGRKILLPLLDREIPLILDPWARPELGSGCVKITPGHDPNDYDVWGRHKDVIAIVNILNPDGTLNAAAGPYAGLDRMDARTRVVSDLESRGLLESVEDRAVEIGHSDRSKTPIEPYLSKQWFVRMGDVPGGVSLGSGTSKPFRSPGLAQAAMDAVRRDWASPSGLRLTFHPDHERYGGTYTSWLAEKRDWCISRQLWWGHRIPIWSGNFDSAGAASAASVLPLSGDDRLHAWIADAEGGLHSPGEFDIARPAAADPSARFDLLVCLRDETAETELAPRLEAAGLVQDPDVLDTWFSSALWPFSTLGWPDPATAAVDPGQRTLGPAAPGLPDALAYYYPGSCLVTGRDIITLWVARMVVMGLYLLGDVPFTDSFIHATIQDGKGERMSKSKGNGIDPQDIIEKYGADAMRYVLCEMQTGTQDIRLPVQAVSPYTGEIVELAEARHGRTVFTYICPKTGKEFDVLGTMPDLPLAKVISERFEVGRAFCTKLWNASRFVLSNLEAAGRTAGPSPADPSAPAPAASPRLEPEDRWILSRLSRTISRVTTHLADYNPAAAIGTAREFFWSDLCDRYLEYVKPRFKDPERAPAAGTVLAHALDRVLRLFHPVVPFITEVIWERLNAVRPHRGLETPETAPELLITAAWPGPEPCLEDPALEADFDAGQDVIRAVRDLRALHNIPPSRKLEAFIKAGPGPARILSELKDILSHMAGLSNLAIGPDVVRPPGSVVQVLGDMEIYLPGLVDPAKETARLKAQLSKLEADRAKAEAKLAKPDFLERAPAAVVESERKKLEELSAQIRLVEDNLRTIK
jgi:valyl-tRNA synthetase